MDGEEIARQSSLIEYTGDSQAVIPYRIYRR
jgi:hypothetical protein